MNYDPNDPMFSNPPSRPELRRGRKGTLLCLAFLIAFNADEYYELGIADKLGQHAADYINQSVSITMKINPFIFRL